jgi:predicted DCC family thiol-disulfide oxidoreductase YuxK
VGAESHPIVLFDGVCNLCNASVRFAVHRDPRGRVRFASLQSQSGRGLLASHGLSADYAGSLVLIDGDRAYLESAGALRIARYLTFPWPLLYALIIVPRVVRDAAYRAVANRRYRWFGRSDVCQLPDAATRDRFL